MSDITLARELFEYGLTEAEGKVYVYLARKGTSPAREVAKALGIQRGQTYNLLESLQKKGIVVTTASKPMRFSGVPLPKALNILVEAQRQRERLMEKLRPELLSMWHSVVETTTEDAPEEKLQFLKGVESIYRKASELIDASEGHVMMIAPEPALYHVDRLGVIERLKKASERNVTVRVLAEITPRTQEIGAHLKEIGARELTDQSPPHFLIIDEREIIFLTKAIESNHTRELNAIWTNSPMLVKAMQRFFENMWSSTSMEPGTPVSELVKKSVLAETKEQTQEALQKEFTKYLTASGFEVKQNHTLVGDSGIEHSFSVALFRDNGKPIVMDIELSSEPIAPIQVIEFFAKKLDVENLVADARLVAKPGLDRDAQNLAMSYLVKFSELG